MAKEARDLGWLTLLAKEAEAFAWKPTAFRQLGDAFFNAKDYATAKTLFEDILNTRPKDRQANERLATVYQRLAEIELTNNPALETPLLAQSDLAITYADFLCLTCQEPEKVAFRYQEIIDDINDLNKEAVIRQLLIYQDLEIQPENVAAALAVIARPPAAKTRYAFLFTGHMIDRADCAQPRFPAAKEPEIRQKIHDALSKAQAGLGPGGTADMVQAAKKIWNKVIPIQP